MSKADPGSAIPASAPGRSTLLRRTPFILMTLALVAASWFTLDLPIFVQADDPEDGAPLWSADISMVELENGAIGAIQAGHFSNQAGSAGLTARWLYYYPPERKLRMSFGNGASVEGHMLQVGHFTLAFDEYTSGNSSFTWDDVDVPWQNEETLAARIVPGSDGDIPATGLPAISGRAQVDEALTAEISGIADQDGLESAIYSYQWQSGGSDINLATGASHTPATADIGKTITVTVSFTDDNGNSESLTSEPTAVVIAANTPATGEPAISGTPMVRKTLTAGVSGITDHDGLQNVSYNYQWLADDVDIDGANSSSYKLTSAETGKTMKVTVSFNDDAGNDEEATSAGTEAVADGPPDAPTITSARRVHVGMLKVDWDDMEDTTGYELEYHHYDIEWLQLPHAPLNYDAHFNGSLALVDGLGTQTGYTFRVRAVNDAGYSDWSDTYTNGFSVADMYGPDKTERPRLEGSPSKPQSLSVSTAGHLEITVSWDPPADSGDSDVTGYRVEFQGPDTALWYFLTTTSDNSYTHRELSPGRTFYYRTSAFNEHGRGQNTARARGTATAHTGKPRWEAAVHKIPDDWELLPEGVDWKHGDRFRLMFITSEARGANSTDIADYNDFVRQAAADGHAAIQEYSSDFRVLASTLAIDAIDNTGTNWSKSNRGLPVYWLKGTRVADNYKDLYDGDWDDPRFVTEVRNTIHTFLDDTQGWITRREKRTRYSFDASQGDYTYTDEYGASMYGRHCHGYYWKVLDLNGNFQPDPLPCIATGSNNGGTAHYSEYLEQCGYYTALGNQCGKVRIGRPTRILPEEQGHGRPIPAVDAALSFAFRETKPAFYATEIEGPPEWSVRLKNVSEGMISLTSLFYAMSPVFEVESAPSLSVADAAGTEGDDSTLDFEVTLYPAAEEEVTVDYTTGDGTAIAGSDYTTTSGTLTFAASETSKTIPVPIIDDMAEDDGETFKLVLSNANGAEIADAEATGTINNTEANTAPTGLPTITGTSRVRETLTADITAVSDADGLDNADFGHQWLADNADINSATESTYTLADGDAGKQVSVRVTFTDDEGHAESLTSAQHGPVAAAVPTAPQGLAVTSDTQTDRLNAAWQTPRSNGGSDITGYTVQWKESADSWDTSADVHEATVTGTSHVITGLTAGTAYTVRVSASNSQGNGAASAEATASTPEAESQEENAAENNQATGLPSISGTPQVGQELTADTSDINDADGLTNVSYSYQWIGDGSDIDGATGSSYTLTSSEQSQTVQVRVTFTDDADNAESLTSVATETVAQAPPTLTVSLENAATSHNGTDVFTFEIRFSEEFGLSYKTLKFHAFTVTGGSVKKAQRMDRDSDTPNTWWLITVEPDGNGDVTITLPATTDCTDDGAICTEDGRMLSNSLMFSVIGPGQ